MSFTTADLLGQFNIVVPLYFYIFYFQQLDMLKYKPIPSWLMISGGMVAKFLIVEKALGIPTENPLSSAGGILVLILAVIFTLKGSYKKRIFYSLWSLACMYISLGIITVTIFTIYDLHSWTELIGIGLYSLGQILSFDTLFALLMLTCIVVKMKNRNIKRDIINIAIIVCFSLIHYVLTAVLFSDYSVVTERNLFFYSLLQLIVIILLVGQYYIFLAHQESSRHLEELKQLQTERDYNLRYYELAKENENKTAQLRHDLQNEIQTVRALIKDGEMESAENIWSEMQSRLNSTKAVQYCSLPLLNAVLNVKLSNIDSNRISTDIVLRSCELIPLSPYNICSLFSNLLDNAIEAVNKEKGDTEIIVHSTVKNDLFLLKVQNTCTNVPQTDKNKNFISDKQEPDHGHGSRIIRRIVQEQSGEYMTEFQDNMMTVIIALPVKNND